MPNKRAIGSRYETQAIRHLESMGYVLVCKNYFTPRGEIDLVFMKSGTLYFVEVKYRSSAAFGSPREAITPKKIMHMKQAALHYVKVECPSYTPFAISFIGVTESHNALHFDFIENIFS